MSFLYFISPFIGYLSCGILKFIINVLKNKTFTLKHIGMGGMPSNHTTIVTTPLALIIINEGLDHPIVGIGAGLLLIVIIDAVDLRKKISEHAIMINKELKNEHKLKERIGHSVSEIIGGLITGCFIAFLLTFLNN